MGLLTAIGLHDVPVPPGGQAFVWEVPTGGYHVRVAAAGQFHDDTCPKTGPHFDTLEWAQRYADARNGGAPFHYPPGDA